VRRAGLRAVDRWCLEGGRTRKGRRRAGVAVAGKGDRMRKCRRRKGVAVAAGGDGTWMRRRRRRRRRRTVGTAAAVLKDGEERRSRRRWARTCCWGLAFVVDIEREEEGRSEENRAHSEEGAR